MMKNGYKILIILFVILQVISFVPPYEKGAVFWIAYLFLMVQFVFSVLLIRSNYYKIDDLKSGMYKFPIAYVCAIGFVIQWILSLLFMILGSRILVWIEILLSITVLGSVLILCHLYEETIDVIEKIEYTEKEKTKFIDLLMLQIEIIYEQCVDMLLKEEIYHLMEQIRYSDPVSREDLRVIENSIESSMKDLENAVKQNDKSQILNSISQIHRDINQRNAMCKMMK